MIPIRRLALHSLVAYLRFLIALGVQFFLVPFVIAKVGTDDYGLWTLTFSVLGLVSLMDFGFTTGVVRFVAEAHGLKDPALRNRVASTTFALFLVISLLASLALATFSAFYCDAFDIPPSARERALILFAVLAARSVLFALPLTVFKAILFGEQHIALTNIIQIITTLSYAAAAVLTLSANLGIIALAVANSLALLLEHILYIIACYLLIPDFRISPSLISRQTLRDTASVSFHQFIVNVGDQILMRTDPIIIKIFLTLHDVALYGVPLKVAENALLLLKQGVHVLGPWVAELKALGDTERLRQVLLSASKFNLAPGLLLATITAVFSEDALTFWVGLDFAPASSVLTLLMASMALTVPQVVAQSVFTMSGLHRLSAYLSAVGVTVNIVLSILLVRPFGISGVAAATLVASFISNILMIGLMAGPRFNAGFRDFAAQVFRPLLAPFLCALLILFCMKVLYPPRSLPAILLVSVPGALAYGLAFYRFSLSHSERSIIRQKFFRS